MKNATLFLLIFLLGASASFSQVGINPTGSSPNAAAGLDVDFTDRGFLPPRLSTAQRDAIPSPPAGLQIYNTDSNCMEFYRGLALGWTSLCPELPTVTTESISSITASSATGGGTVLSDGGATVSARGVCWSTSPNPTTADNVSSDGTGVGSFVSSLTGLTGGTTYYVRAYATNSAGTAYGNEESFSTTALISYTSVGSTTWTAPAGVTSVEVLVVAGGGGGGAGRAGGGGGGGLIYNPSYSVTPGNSYTVTVGAGGNGSTANNAKGGNGSNSVFASLTAIGGGGGGSDSNMGGASGGSGGGGAGNGGGGAGGSGTGGQGNNGGNAADTSPEYPGGGGGGAGSAGANATGSTPGNGGAGAFYSISGVSTAYAGGGGGGKYLDGASGSGGIGGGGDGSPNLTTPGSPGVANTGGGGGGGSHNLAGGNGGSGIVILKY